MSSVLITGANRGIGRAIATEFAGRGHRVVATARDPHTLADVAAAERLALDVTDDASVTAAVAAAGDIDIVVANAGVIFYAAVEATPVSELQRLFTLNTVGAICPHVNPSSLSSFPPIAKNASPTPFSLCSVRSKG